LLIENWSLRHQLQAAQYDLVRAGLNRQPGEISRANQDPRQNEEKHFAALGFLGIFSTEQARICGVLMLVAFVLVTANTVRCVRTFAPASDTSEIWADLDSFSEPGLAQAVLRRDAEKLLINYTDSYNVYLQDFDSWRRSYTAWLSATGLSDSTANANRYAADHGKRPDFATDAWILRFRTSLSDLRATQTVEELEHSLLLMYQRNGLWPEFVGLFLDIVRKCPSNPDIVTWAEPALRHAHDCGKADQVLAYLQLAAQTESGYLPTSLAPILKRWGQPTHGEPPLVFDFRDHEPQPL
jgi:hypothetical protein